MVQKPNSTETIKFLYSYGGKIVPRPTDGKLRYAGGVTRVLAVDRSVSCSELLVKFVESCGSSMILKCKLPTEDLDVLVSIKSDEELRIVIEEYERVSPESKIRAILFPAKSVKKITPPSSPAAFFPTKSAKKITPPSSPVSCFDFPSISKPYVAAVKVPQYHKSPPCAAAQRYTPPVVGHPVAGHSVVGYPVAPAARNHCYDARNSRHLYNAPRRIYTH